MGFWGLFVVVLDRLHGHDTEIIACRKVTVLVHISTGFRIEFKAAELWVNYVV